MIHKATVILCVFLIMPLSGQVCAANDAPDIIGNVSYISKNLPFDFPILLEITPKPKSVKMLTPVKLQGPDKSQTLKGDMVEFGGKVYAAAMIHGLPNDKKATLSILPASLQGKPLVTIKPLEDGGLEALSATEPITRYNTKDTPKPFLWPVYAPGGIEVTRNYPMKQVAGEDQDHPHHRGLWFTHGDVNGVDFWAEGAGKGKIVEVSRNYASGQILGMVHSKNNWIGPDDKKVCEDEREYLFWSTGKVHIIDIAVTIKASQGAVILGDTKEGTFAIRVPKWMIPKDGGHIINSEGLQDAAAWGKRAKWLTYWGNTGEKTVGVAILEYPDNFRFPTYWHARDYGLFAANPFGYKDFTGDKTQDGSASLNKGEFLTLKYRVLLYTGTPTEAGLKAFADQFALMSSPAIKSRRGRQ